MRELSLQHKSVLYESGLCEMCVTDTLCHTISDGMKIPYPGTDFYRVRLDAPTGKQKYTQPSGTPSRLYFASGYMRWSKGAESIFITEGEKKAMALDCKLRGRAGVIGIGGVWNWVGGKDRDRRMLIEDFNRVDWRGRQVYIVFDSDAVTNRQVLMAEQGLATALKEKGAKPRIVVLGTEQKGIDDWIYIWTDSWEKELYRLCREARPTRGQRLHSVYDRVYTFEDMISKKFPIPEFYCGSMSLGLVGQGMITIIHGPTNVGKTYLATQLAMSIATGDEFLGHPCRQSRVMVFQGELPPGLYAQGRLRPLVTQRGAPDNVLFYNWAFNFAESSRFKEAFTGEAWAGFDRLEDMLDEHNPDVVMIDPLQSYHNLVETSNDQLRELLKRMKSLAMARNIGFVLVDHDRKAAGDGNASVRGASAKTDLSDCVIGIARGDMGAVMSYDKVRYISSPLPSPKDIHMKDSLFYPGPDPSMFTEHEEE